MKTLISFLLHQWKMILLLFLGGILIGYLSKKPSTGQELRRLTPEIETVTLSLTEFGHAIEVPGTITYLEKASISSRIPGRLATYYVDQGDAVEEGTALGELEKLEIELQLSQAEAELQATLAQERLASARYGQARRSIEQRLKRIESTQASLVEARAQFLRSRQDLLNKADIYRMGGISKKELKTLYAQYLNGLSRYFQARKGYQIDMVGFRMSDLEKSNRDLKKADLTDARSKTEAFIDFNTEVERRSLEVARQDRVRAAIEVQNLRRLLGETVLRSPIRGVVVSRSLETGEEIKPGEPIFTVVRLDELLVTTNVSEKDLPHIKKGQSVAFTVDALNGDSFTGTVRFISPVVDLSTRTAEVRIHVRNTDLRISPGMFARCAIQTTEKRTGLLLPESALAEPVDQVPGHTSVFVIQDGRAFRRNVQVGMHFDRGYEVLSGLKKGETVATSAVAYLRDGRKVQAREASP